MAAETIRDVIIRVAIENGNMRLGPLDTSAARASVKDFESSVQQMARNNASSLNGHGSVNQSTFGPGAGTRYQGYGGGQLASMLGGISGGGSGAGGLPVPAINALTVSLTALAAALLATKTASDEAKQYNESYWRQLTNDAVKTQQWMTSRALRQYEHAEELTMSQTNLKPLERFLPNFHRQEKTEQSIRAYEASDVRSDFKTRHRSQTLEREGLNDQRVALDDDRDFKQNRLDELRKAQEQLERDRDNIKSKNAQIEKSFKDEKAAAFTESTWSWLGRQSYRAGAAVGVSMLAQNLPINTGIGESGYWHKQEMKGAEVGVAAKQSRIQSEQEFKNIQDKVTESLAEQQRLSEDIARIDQRRLTTSKELRQNAYEAVQKEQERIRSGNIDFGTASIADQNRIMRIQKKHERIEAQREANRKTGRPLDEGIERFTPMEMRTNVMGNIAGKSMRRQAEKTAEDKGFKQETNLPQLDEILKAEMAKPLDTTKHDVNQSKNQAKEIAAIIREAIEAKEPVGNALEIIKRELEQLKEELKLRRMTSNSLWRW